MRHMLMFIFTVVIAGSAFHAASQVTITDDQFTHNAVGRINTAAIVNANAYVYCWLYGNGLYCGASDGAGKFASCSTTDPAFKRLFAMMKPNTTVRFFWRPADGSCEAVEVFASSRYLRPPPSPATSKASAPVFVNAGSRYAYGALAVKADTPNQDIGCNVQSGSTAIYCTAQDNAGNFVFCGTDQNSVNQTLADQKLALAGLNESSLLYFSWDNDPNTPTATCNFIYVLNASYYLP